MIFVMQFLLPKYTDIKTNLCFGGMATQTDTLQSELEEHELQIKLFIY